MEQIRTEIAMVLLSLRPQPSLPPPSRYLQAVLWWWRWRQTQGKKKREFTSAILSPLLNLIILFLPSAPSSSSIAVYISCFVWFHSDWFFCFVLFTRLCLCCVFCVHFHFMLTLLCQNQCVYKCVYLQHNFTSYLHNTHTYLHFIYIAYVLYAVYYKQDDDAM